MSWFSRSKQDEKMMQYIKIIRQSPGGRTNEAVFGLRAYGVACLEPVIRETKDMTWPGSVAGIRDSVFMTMQAADALPIMEQLMNDPDPDIQLVSAIAMSMFDYQGREDLKSKGIGMMRYIQKRARYRGDNFAQGRIDELLKEMD